MATPAAVNPSGKSAGFWTGLRVWAGGPARPRLRFSCIPSPIAPSRRGSFSRSGSAQPEPVLTAASLLSHKGLRISGTAGPVRPGRAAPPLPLLSALRDTKGSRSVRASAGPELSGRTGTAHERPKTVGRCHPNPPQLWLRGLRSGRSGAGPGLSVPGERNPVPVPVCYIFPPTRKQLRHARTRTPLSALETVMQPMSGSPWQRLPASCAPKLPVRFWTRAPPEPEGSLNGASSLKTGSEPPRAATC
ncbi:hypothetical protein OJAV_G00027690 [Oryzias javanicus]|uniref:Uncharacterized protein n=1 Tax=Oryzias javanicus TaxID=123683 RepID=A0A437DJV8_ORYJA|nr:hypothetical protein OJAV_G00027690 [Oryzias javanicus]